MHSPLLKRRHDDNEISACVKCVCVCVCVSVAIFCSLCSALQCSFRLGTRNILGAVGWNVGHGRTGTAHSGGGGAGRWIIDDSGRQSGAAAAAVARVVTAGLRWWSRGAAGQSAEGFHPLGLHRSGRTIGTGILAAALLHGHSVAAHFGPRPVKIALRIQRKYFIWVSVNDPSISFVWGRGLQHSQNELSTVAD